MNIAQSALKAQVLGARRQWPFIAQIEAQYGLPRFLLFAVGSRETNLRNIIGDGGHGYGVFQRDNRSWHVDSHYLADVQAQANDAAQLLVANKAKLGTWRAACAAYNAGAGNVHKAQAAGKDVDAYTTGHDYAADVVARAQALQVLFPVVTHSAGGAGGSRPRVSYVVKPGDNLTSIADRFHTTVAKIVALNHIKDSNVIRVGQKLFVS